MRSIVFSVAIVATALMGCAVELEHSSVVPTDEVRQQYEITYAEGTKAIKVAAFNGRTTRISR